MKWIKASERLPIGISGVAKQIVLRWQFVDNVQLRISTDWQLLDIVKTLFDLNKIEWLDEKHNDLHKDLTDFFIWFRNEGETHIGKSIEKMVDEYINQSLL